MVIYSAGIVRARDRKVLFGKEVLQDTLGQAMSSKGDLWETVLGHLLTDATKKMVFSPHCYIHQWNVCVNTLVSAPTLGLLWIK